MVLVKNHQNYYENVLINMRARTQFVECHAKWRARPSRLAHECSNGSLPSVKRRLFVDRPEFKVKSITHIRLSLIEVGFITYIIKLRILARGYLIELLLIC